MELAITLSIVERIKTIKCRKWYETFSQVSIREDLLGNGAVLVSLRNEQWANSKFFESFQELQFSFVGVSGRRIVKLLQACGKVGALNKGKHVLKFANIWNYSFKGLFDDAKKVLNQMEGEGIEPDLVTRKSLVWGCSMWGQNKDALAVINQMKRFRIGSQCGFMNFLISRSLQNENCRETLEFLIQLQQ